MKFSRWESIAWIEEQNWCSSSTYLSDESSLAVSLIGIEEILVEGVNYALECVILSIDRVNLDPQLLELYHVS